MCSMVLNLDMKVISSLGLPKDFRNYCQNLDFYLGQALKIGLVETFRQNKFVLSCLKFSLRTEVRFVPKSAV